MQARPSPRRSSHGSGAGNEPGWVLQSDVRQRNDRCPHSWVSGRSYPDRPGSKPLPPHQDCFSWGSNLLASFLHLGGIAVPYHGCEASGRNARGSGLPSANRVFAIRTGQHMRAFSSQSACFMLFKGQQGQGLRSSSLEELFAPLFQPRCKPHGVGAPGSLCSDHGPASDDSRGPGAAGPEVTCP